MSKAWYHTNNQTGFSLVEVLLASSIFALLITALVGAYLYGQESTILAGNRARATLLAEEGLEAVRNIRDENYSNLPDGTYGLAIPGTSWTLSGSSDTTGIFTREIVIASVDSDRKSITANVSWPQNAQRTGIITIVSRLTNWQDTSGVPTCSDQASYLSINSSGANLQVSNRELRDILVGNTNALCDIVFDKITVSWTDSSKNIERIDIGAGTPTWTGSALSGTELDITNTTLTNTEGQTGTTYRFSGNMAGNIFTITLKMSDGTTKTQSGIMP